MKTLIAAVRSRLHDETGMALVMAVGVSAVLAIMGGSLVLYSTSSEGSANRSRFDLRAYQLAQSGIDAAASLIAAQPLTDGRQSSTVFSSRTLAQRTLSFGTGETVVYNGTLYDDTPAGVVGTPLVRPYRWMLTAIATVPGPDGASSTVSRTLGATMLLSPQAPATTVQSQAWKYVYSKAADNNNATCEVTLPNNSDYAQSFYVSGTLCLTGNGDLNGTATGPPVEVIAKQGIWINSPAADIGLSTPVSRVETDIVNRCRYRNTNGPTFWGQVCRKSPIPNVHVTATTTVAPSTTIVTGPSTSFTNTALLGDPGPGHPCQTKSGAYPDFATMTSTSTFSLTGASYTCKNAAGELSYDSSTRILTIRGLIYFPGNLAANGNVAVQYKGIAAIYVAGSYNQQQTALCAVLSGTSCNWTASAWDTTANVLLIAAAGVNGAIGGPSCVSAAGGNTSILLEQATQFQGAVYADGTTNICYQNLSTFQGPSVANAQIFANQVVYMPMPTAGVVKVPFGAPGQSNPVTDYDVTPPINYTG